MLTKVYLEGVMGKEFGEEWELEVSSPAEALRMINANKPGVFAWIANNLEVYSHYRVICTSEANVTEMLDETDIGLERRVKEIRFVPIIAGSGGIGKMIMGVVLIAVGVYTGNPMLVKMGVMMTISGVIGVLSAVPVKTEQQQVSRDDGTSYYFNGPVNTTQQGVPVALIYGTCLVGSHAVSARLTIDQF